MSHPPPTSHRMGDKKRYYYSNNPNNAMRHGHSAFPKKTYNSLNSGNGTSPEPAPSVNLNPNMSSSRHSRYDPNSPKKQVANKSRYNPEVDISQSPAPVMSLSDTNMKQGNMSDNVATSTPPISGASSSAGGSRYSGSRYNQAQSHVPEARVLNATLAQPSAVSGAKIPAPTFSNTNRQTRPRSIDLSKKDVTYHYQSPSPGSGIVPNNINHNSASSYYSRTNKWRSISGPPSKLDYDSYSSSSQQTTRTPFWKAQLVPQPAPQPVPQPVPQGQARPQQHQQEQEKEQLQPELQLQLQSQVQPAQHQQQEIQPQAPQQNEMQEQPQSQIQSQPQSRTQRQPSLQLPTDKRNNVPTKVNTMISPETSNTTPKNEHRFEKTPHVLSEEKSFNEGNTLPESQEEDSAVLKNSNPHSLGSSLINSVPQTTRKVEERHATDHIKVALDQEAPVPRSKIEPNTKEIQSKETGGIRQNILKDNKPSALEEISGLWSTSKSPDYIVNEEEGKEEEGNDREVGSIFQGKSNWYSEDYEFLYDPMVLRTDFKKLNAYPPVVGYSMPLKPIDKCIFPMSMAQTKLWELKNQTRRMIIKEQKYLLKKPVKSLKSYPFMKQNILIYKQAVRPILLKSISKIKNYEYLRKLQLRKQFFELDSVWQRKCSQMDKTSNALRKEEIERKKEENEKDVQEQQKQGIDHSKDRNTVPGSSRRRNRADFVDDAEIENILLQIDPDYKHHQLAAKIPSMIIDPVEKYSKKFKDVNNLVTDKQDWASRLLRDGVDTFTEQEHEHFVEGYLTFPKKFGKISYYMGGLRTPEECVLHYYRTKDSVDYKRLLNDKNKKRQKGAVAKRRKKKDKNGEMDVSTNVDVESAQDNYITPEPQENEPQETTEVHGSENQEPQEQDVLVEDQKIQKNNDNTDKDGQLHDKIVPMEQVEIKFPLQDSGIENQLEKTGKSKQNDVDNRHQSRESDNIMDGSSVKRDDFMTTLELDVVTLKKRPHEMIEDSNGGKRSIDEDSISLTKSNDENNINLDGKNTSICDPMDSDPEKFDTQSDDNTTQRKKQKQGGEHKSSYWSVKEANLFPELLKAHGSQWSLISERLGTKSTTMVRNYYQRNAAQLGWKSDVEEADFKRNVTSSGSVQQSQILIQSEQSPVGAIYNGGVPPQQRPALGFFSNSSSSKDKSCQQPADDSNSLPFASDTSKELFSQSATPVSTLPPPRLPSIHLPSVGGATVNTVDPHTHTLDVSGVKLSDVHASARLPSSYTPPDLLHEIEQPPNVSLPVDKMMQNMDRSAGVTSSILTILNKDERSNVLPKISSSNHDASSAGESPNIAASGHLPPSIGKVVLQELQSTAAPPSSKRPTSLSLLLNPDYDKPANASPGHVGAAASPIPHKHSNVRSEHTLPLFQQGSSRQQARTLPPPQLSVPPVPPNINFAMDPLGALAAIASESLMPPGHSKKESTETNQADKA